MHAGVNHESATRAFLLRGGEQASSTASISVKRGGWGPRTCLLFFLLSFCSPMHRAGPVTFHATHRFPVLTVTRACQASKGEKKKKALQTRFLSSLFFFPSSSPTHTLSGFLFYFPTPLTRASKQSSPAFLLCFAKFCSLVHCAGTLRTAHSANARVCR